MGLDGVELIMAIEDAFGIEIDDEEAAEIRTLGELHRCVYRKLVSTSDLSSEADAWVRLCDVVVAQMGIDRSELTPEAEIVADLGIE